MELDQLFPSIVNIIAEFVLSGILLYILLIFVFFISTLQAFGKRRNIQKIAGWFFGVFLAFSMFAVIGFSGVDLTPTNQPFSIPDEPISLGILTLLSIIGLSLGIGFMLLMSRLANSDGGMAIFIGMMSLSSTSLLIVSLIVASYAKSIITTIVFSFIVGVLFLVAIRGPVSPSLPRST